MCIRVWPQESPVWLFWSWRQLARRLIMTSSYYDILNLLYDQSHAYHACSSICKTGLKIGTTFIVNRLEIGESVEIMEF